MNHRRGIACAVFAALLAGAFWTAPADAQGGRIKQIVPGVWFREGERDQAHSNNVIIELETSLAIVDANFPSAAKLVIADARRISPKPIRYVLVTHNHGDHLYGTALFTRLGAVTVAHADVLAEIKRVEPARWQLSARAREDVRELNLDGPEPPQLAFTQSPWVLEDARRRIEFHHFGWAHTRGDGLVYLPDDKVLVTGDATTNGPFNNTADGSITNWPKVLEAAEKLGAEHVLPGHGPPGGPEILTGQALYFVELRKAVEQGVKRGQTLEQITQTIQLPDSVSHWKPGNLTVPVRVAYQEVTGAGGQ